MNKLFCLGLHKTGTATFREAVKILGFTNFSNSRDELLDTIKKGDFEPVFKIVRQYDAFKAWPWAVIYKELDKEFPGSKFVLTVRDPDKWIQSSVSHFWNEETPMRKWIFGTGSPRGNEKQHLEVYKRHCADVVDYFYDKPEDLMIVDWEYDGWNLLCEFLGKEIPDVPFPHYNKKIVNRKHREEIKAYGKRKNK